MCAAMKGSLLFVLLEVYVAATASKPKCLFQALACEALQMFTFPQAKDVGDIPGPNWVLIIHFITLYLH